MARKPLVFERLLPAPPDVVFQHWSDPESLALWMQPEDGMRPASVTVDFRVGGHFEIVMHGARDFRQHGRYLEIEPARRIVMEWNSEWMPPGERETRLTVTFEPVGEEQTRLVLTHDELPDGDSYDGHEGGWTRILGEVEQAFGKRRGSP